VNEEAVGGRRVSNEEDDVKEIEQVVEKLEEVVGGHGRQQDVVRRDHRRPAEDDQRQGVAGQPGDADDRIDDEPGDEPRQLVELGVRRRRLGGRRDGAARRRRRDVVVVHLRRQVPARSVIT